MQDAALTADGVVPLTQGERVVDTYIAPSKTFLDLRRDASWWLPCILVLLFTMAAVFTANKKVGVEEMRDSMLRHMPKMQERIDSMPPDQQAKIRQSFESNIQRAIVVAPVTTLVSGFVVGALFLVLANFVFGGKATYWQMVAVFWYSMLPFLVLNLLSMALVAGGVGVENYNAQNPVGTNIGYYMEGSSPMLVALLSAVDLFSVWIFALQGIGIAKVARIGTAAGFGVAGILWVLYIGTKMLPALFM